MRVRAEFLKVIRRLERARLKGYRTSERFAYFVCGFDVSVILLNLNFMRNCDFEIYFFNVTKRFKVEYCDLFIFILFVELERGR